MGKNSLGGREPKDEDIEEGSELRERKKKTRKMEGG